MRFFRLLILTRSGTLFLLLFSACGLHTIRSDYGLNHYDELVVSDSQSILIQPQKITKGEIEINHLFLIQNTSNKNNYEINLSKASFRISENTIHPACKSSTGQTNTIPLESTKKYRIDCTIRLIATPENKLSLKDQIGTLEIPYGKPNGIIAFKYFLKIEDFE